MNGRAEFLEKLNGLLKLAQSQENRITIEEVRAYFSQDALTEEQMILVFDYLLAQKVTVKGYIKVGTEETETEKTFSEEELACLKEYEEEFQNYPVLTREARDELCRQASEGDALATKHLMEGYLQEMLAIAKEMHRPEVFLGDLIQEGGLGLATATTDIAGKTPEEIHEGFLREIRQSIQSFIEEQAECTSRDRKMVEKVQILSDSIEALTEELGRKVSIDELAVYVGMEIEEIEDILKLMGEDTEEEEE